MEVLGFKLSTQSQSVEQAIKFSQLYWYMITFMAEKQLYSASIIIQISFEKGHFTTGSVYIYSYA